MQVGYFGLLKAISHFDPAAGAGLAAYARPCISGELKRYFRDKRWSLHVDRPVQELILAVRDATEPLTQQLGRTPADSDLARHLGVSGDKVRQARQAQLAFSPSSLDAPQADHGASITLADSLGGGGSPARAHARHARRLRPLGRASPARAADPDHGLR